MQLRTKSRSRSPGVKRNNSSAVGKKVSLASYDVLKQENKHLKRSVESLKNNIQPSHQALMQQNTLMTGQITDVRRKASAIKEINDDLRFQVSKTQKKNSDLQNLVEMYDRQIQRQDAEIIQPL